MLHTIKIRYSATITFFFKTLVNLDLKSNIHFNILLTC